MNNSSGLIRRYTSISAVIDTLWRRKLAILNPDNWDDRNDRYYMALYKELRHNSGGLYGLCAAQCSETYHHWRVFTDGAEGASIELDKQRLEDTLSRVLGARYGPVNYLRLDEADQLSEQDVDRLPFLKRAAFEDEQEYRIVVGTNKPQTPAFDIPLELSWIKRIRLNPWIPKRISASMIKVIHTIPDCDKLDISRSHLIENLRWKRAGDRVVEKPIVK